MKKHFLLIVAIVLSMPILKAGLTLPGAGTVSSPYLISTPAQLIEVSDSIQRDSVVVGKMLYRNMHYKVTENLDMAGVSWTPIGIGGTNSFRGVFDGNNKIIKNLTMGTAATRSAISIAGLFGVVSSSATVKNIVLENVSIFSTITTKGDCAIGALAGSVTESSVVNNCHASGVIDVDYVGIVPVAPEVAGSMVVGGLIAKLNSTLTATFPNPTTVINCMTNVKITAKNSGTVLGTQGAVSGLIGLSPNAAAPMTRAEIINCYALGDITAESSTQALAVSGIVARNCPNVYNVYSACNLNAKSTTGLLNCNGIVGVRGGGIVSAIALFDNITTESQTNHTVYRMINTATNCNQMFANPDVTVNGNKILSDNLNATQDKIFGENLTDMVNQPKTILNEYVANYIAIRTIPMLRWTASANINAGKPVFENTYIPQPTAVKRLTINGLKAYATNGKLIVEGEASGMQILVYNTTGQLVWTGLKSDARMEVSLAKGIYLVQGIGKVIVY
jgi:hypothetical protein